MRHKVKLKKLGRNPSHRRALLRNLATSLVLNDQIETTLPKAKSLKRVADKLVTLGKTDTLHHRRQAMQFLTAVNRTETGNAQKWTAVHKLFTEIAPRYSERKGGYTRVLRTRKRPGDNAQLALIQFVEKEMTKKSGGEKRKRRVKKADAAPEAPKSKKAPAAEAATAE